MTKDAQTVLSMVNQEAADGYTIQNRTGLSQEQLISALQELIRGALVRVEGDLSPPAVGKVYVWVPTDRKGDAEIAARSP